MKQTRKELKAQVAALESELRLAHSLAERGRLVILYSEDGDQPLDVLYDARVRSVTLNGEREMMEVSSFFSEGFKEYDAGRWRLILEVQT